MQQSTNPGKNATSVLMAKGAAQMRGDNANVMLSIAGVVYKIGASRSAIYDWMARNQFPKPIKLGPRRVGWKNSDIDAWLGQREAA